MSNGILGLGIGAAELGVMIPILALLGFFFLAALRILKGSGGRGATTDPNETKLIQDIYHGLLKMEERVEALETLLLDRERKGGVQ